MIRDKTKISFIATSLVLLSAPSAYTPSAHALDGVCVMFCDEGGSSGGGYDSGGYSSGGYDGGGNNDVDYSGQYHQQGLDAFNNRDYAMAVEMFEKALSYEYDSVTELMLNRSRRGLTFNIGHEAYEGGDYASALSYMQEALIHAHNANYQEPTPLAQEWVDDIQVWVTELERVVRDKSEDERWASNLKDAKPRINAILDDLRQTLTTSPDFVAPDLPVNASGELALMSTSMAKPWVSTGTEVVDLRGSSGNLPTVLPGQLASPAKQKGLKINPVPSPSATHIASEWVRMNAQKPPEMILEALEKGNGNIRSSVDYMRARMQSLNPEDREAREALSYLEALEVSYADAEKAGFEDNALMKSHIQWETELRAGEATSKNQWRLERQFLVNKALDAVEGDVEKAITYLSKLDGNNAYTKQQAVRYLQGLNAYQIWQAQGGKE